MRRPRRKKRMVFVSHSARDTWVARQVAREITRCGARPFLDEAEIGVGQDFEEEILGFLEEADELVVFNNPVGARTALRLGRIGGSLDPQDSDYCPAARDDAGRAPGQARRSCLSEEAERDRSQRRRRLLRRTAEEGPTMSKRRIFIFHAGAERDWVRAFAESLRARGVAVWLDEWQVRPGEPVEEALEEGLRTSDTIAFVLTPESIHRPDLFFDLGVAIAMRKRAVPIVPADLETSRLPYPLRVRQPLPKESPEETAERLLAETAA